MDQGVLNPPQANGLLPKLENARQTLEKGKPEKAMEYIQKAIVNHLRGLHNSGKLNDEQFGILMDIIEGPKPGDEGIITDRQGNSYRWKIMNDGRKWLVDNLRYEVADSWIYPGSNPILYGRLYTGHVAKNICQEAFGNGWTGPEKPDWERLVATYGTGPINGWDSDDGIYASSTSAYNVLIQGGASGFDAVLGGYRFSTGEFITLGGYGNYWCVTDYEPWAMWRYTFFIGGSLDRSFYFKGDGLSCRCLQN